MKLFKRLLIVFAVLFILLIGAAIAIPYFFKDDILATLKEEINKNVNAEVDFRDIDISLLRSFPDFSLAILDYAAKGKDDFAGITLAKGKSMDLSLDIWSVLSSTGPMQLKSVNFDEPNIHVIVTRDGKANYDIFGPTSTEETTSSEFVIQLDNYSVSNGHLIYDDRTMPVYLEIEELNHEGSGNFTQDIYDLTTTTKIKAITTEYDGVKYLTKAKTALDATININNQTARYTLKENELQVNDLFVKADGWLEMKGDDIKMDLKFDTPQNSFKNLFSLIPSAYIADYEDVKIEGQFALNGAAKGVFNSIKEEYPAFNINLNIDNGDVKYPDLPLGITDIDTKMNINSPSSDLNKMVVDISNFNVKIGNNPLSGRFKLRTPLSDPDIDTKIKGVLNLGDLAKAFPMEGVQEMSGIINADVAAKARMSVMDSGNYENVNVTGTANVKDIKYIAEGMPPVQLNSLAMDFSPKQVSIDNFDAKLGKSDMRGNGQINNILAFFAKDKTMKGAFNISSNYFNADEWMTTEASTTTPVATTTTSTPAPTNSEPFDNFNFDFDANMKKIDYDIYELENLTGTGNISSNTLTISNFFTEVNGSDIQARGTIGNVLNFVNYNEGITGDITFASKYFDLDRLMGTETTAATPPSTEPTVSEIPDIKYNLNLNGTVDQVKYDIYTLTDMRMSGNITEKQIQAKSFYTNIGKSDIAGKGVINDYMEYVFKNETVSGTLDLNSKLFDLNEFMAEDPNAAALPEPNPEEVDPIPVPENMAFDINANMEKVVYTNMTLRDIKGKIVVAEQAAVLEDITAKTLGGRVGIAGSYDTKDIQNPAFTFKYDLQNLDFQEVFNTLNTFQAAAPIGKFLKGNFNSTLVMDGKLTPSLMPQLNTLSADGFLQTLEAVLDGFKPLQAIGDKLGVEAFNDLKIKGTKNWFTIKEGKVNIQPFDYFFKGMDLNIGGWHGLDQTLDYDIKAKIPRELIGKNAVGAAANKGLDFLSGQASKLGFNLDAGEFVNVQINLTGSVTAPKVGVKLLGTEGEGSVKDQAVASAKEEIEKAKDKAVDEAKERIDEQKERATAAAERARDSIQKLAEQKAEEAKKKAEAEIAKKAEEAKEKVGAEIADKAKEKIDEVVDEKTKEEIKDKLKDFNPFKRKKKDKDKEKNGGN